MQERRGEDPPQMVDVAGVDAVAVEAVGVERVDHLDQPHHRDDRRQQRSALDRPARRRGHACASGSARWSGGRLALDQSAKDGRCSASTRDGQRHLGALAQRRREHELLRACGRRRRAGRGRRRSAGSCRRSGWRRWRRRGGPRRSAGPAARAAAPSSARGRRRRSPSRASSAPSAPPARPRRARPAPRPAPLERLQPAGAQVEDQLAGGGDDVERVARAHHRRARRSAARARAGRGASATARAVAASASSALRPLVGGAAGMRRRGRWPSPAASRRPCGARPPPPRRRRSRSPASKHRQAS